MPFPRAPCVAYVGQRALYFYHVNSGVWTQAVMLGGKHLYLLSYLSVRQLGALV